MRVVLIALLLITTVAHAGDGHHEKPTTAPAREIELRPGRTLGAPIREGHLLLYPIIADGPGSLPYTTLQDGLDRGVVDVRENRQDARTVVVTNHSKAPLSIMRGELLVGGHQDRLTAIDWTIQPGETTTIAVYCAEAARFEGPSDRFEAGHAVAELSVRYALDNNPGRAQHEIWEAIRDANVRERTTNETDAYRFAAARLETRARAVARDRMIRRISGPAVVGFTVAIDDELMGVHEFPTPAVFRRVAPMVLAGYTPSI